MKVKTRYRPGPHIPFISLADIAWQVIIFFFVASSFAQNDSLKVDMPAASDQKGQQESKTITVQATESSILVDGKPVQLADLEGNLQKALAGKKSEADRAVVIEGRDDLSFQRDVQVMYAIQKAGGVLVMEEEQK